MNTTDREAPASDVLTITSTELASECELLERAIESEGGDVASVAAAKPGGLENRHAGALAWRHYFRQLDRLHGALTASATSRRHTPIDEVLPASLADEAVYVRFSDGVVRAVHPKSYHALAFLDSLDRQHKLDAEAAAASAQLLSKEDAQTYALAPLVTSLAQRLWLWILCSPNASLPFDEGDTKVEPPKWTKRVTPEDLIKVFEAHVELHQQRLAIMARAFPSESGGKSRLPLAGFIGAVASETGQDARLLMRAHSIGKLFASSISAAQASREARERADANAKDR